MNLLRSLFLLLALATAWLASCPEAKAQTATVSVADSTAQAGGAGTTSSVTVVAGPAFTGRVLCVQLYNFNNFTPLTTTIDGVAAVVITLGPVPAGYVLACVVSNTANTSVVVTETFATSTTMVTVGTLVISGAASATPSSSNSNQSGAALSLNVPAGGAVIAYNAGAWSAGATWTGATQVISDGVDMVSIALFNNTGGALSGYSITYSDPAALLGAAFAPASAPTTSPHLSLLGAGH